MSPQISKRLLVAAGTLLLVLLTTTVVTACPTCKDGMTHDPDTANMAQGYFWSIIFMMSMPFLIFSSLVTYFYLLVRSARKAQPVVAAPQA